MVDWQAPEPSLLDRPFHESDPVIALIHDQKVARRIQDGLVR